MRALTNFFSLGLALVAFIIGSFAHAYDLKPIVVQLSPSGPGSAQSIIITNSHEQPIAIEVEAFVRIQRPDGTEERQAEDEDIIISPPQLVIAPGASQAVRLRWVGDPDPEKEMAFRIISSQLPIRLTQEKREDFTADVSVNYRYEVALYVTPSTAVPAARIVRAEPVRGDDGAQLLEVEIASEGTRRASLEQPKIIVTPQSGSTIVMEGEAVASLEQLVILADSRRVVRVPWPEGVAVGPVQAELQTRYIVLQ